MATRVQMGRVDASHTAHISIGPGVGVFAHPDDVCIRSPEWRLCQGGDYPRLNAALCAIWLRHPRMVCSSATATPRKSNGHRQMSITEGERMGWWPTILGLAAVVVGVMTLSFCSVTKAFTMTAGMPLVEQRGSS